MANQLDTKHLALASLSMRGLGHKSVITILSKADTIPQTAADFETLLQATIGQRTKERTTDEFKAAFDRGGSILADATAQNIVVCPYNDPIYPVRLRSIENPPSVIYVKGNLDCLSNSAALAIVGTRHPTTWGGQTARRVAHRCAENHVTVVS